MSAQNLFQLANIFHARLRQSSFSPSISIVNSVLLAGHVGEEICIPVLITQIFLLVFGLLKTTCFSWFAISRLKLTKGSELQKFSINAHLLAEK